MENPVIIEEKIIDILKSCGKIEKSEIKEILEKAEQAKGLEIEDVAKLLSVENREIIEEFFFTAKKIKEKIYGKRIVFFAPLYITNKCINNCLYCGFRKDNKEQKRKTLTLDEIREEVRALENFGHKRLLLVFGESRDLDIDYVVKTIETVYNTKNGKGEIRRVNVNIAPMEVCDFKKLKQAKIGTYQLFQETYHRKTYKFMHPEGPKSDYEFRITAPERAIQAGIDDIGIGVLFGLYDYKFEVLSLLSHANYLDKKYGVGPHTISVPRIKPAIGAPLSLKPPYPVSDFEFKKIVAILRMAVPYTGIILSTRERKELRDELFSLGVSQISAGSKTQVGGYAQSLKSKTQNLETQQFHIEDTRTLEEVIRDIGESGYIPSFCTACYRCGRTGESFMKLSKIGFIKNFCTPNAILTFKEYLLDYGKNEIKDLGENLIEELIKEIENKSIREKLSEKIKLLESGERDIYF
jgi:2-iminoacetate synthase